MTLIGRNSCRQTDDYSIARKRIELGMIVGSGLLLSRNFDINIRYNFGITSVVNYDDIRNSVIQILIGYSSRIQ